MNRTTPIGWDDITDEVWKGAAKTVAQKHRISSEYAMDLVLDAAIQLVKRRVIPTNAAGLLVKTAQYKLQEDRRQAAQQRPVFAVAEPLEDEYSPSGDTTSRDGDPASIVEERDTADYDKRRIGDALRELSPGDSSLLTAYYIDGKPLHTIDAENGQPKGRSRVRVHRARSRMRQMLQKRAVDRDPR